MLVPELMEQDVSKISQYQIHWLPKHRSWHIHSNVSDKCLCTDSRCGGIHPCQANNHPILSEFLKYIPNLQLPEPNSRHRNGAVILENLIVALLKEIINNAYEELNNKIADKVERSDRFNLKFCL
jgi:hypothetical protein